MKILGAILKRIPETETRPDMGTVKQRKQTDFFCMHRFFSVDKWY